MVVMDSTMEDYISRFYAEKTKQNKLIVKKQALKNHLLQVSVLAKEFGEFIGLPNTMKLAGLIHDMGKYSQEFTTFIMGEMERCIKLGEEYKKAKSGIDHGRHGAAYIYKRFYPNCSSNYNDKMTIEVIMLICCYHHGGLPDCVSENGQVKIIERIQNISEDEMKQVETAFMSEIDVDIDDLFEKAKEEIKVLMSRVGKAKSKDQYFMLTLIAKLAYSILVDADRLDSMSFEMGEDAWKEHLDETVSLDKLKSYSEHLEQYIYELNCKKTEDSGTKRVNEIRAEIAKECMEKAKLPSGVYNLTVPTGGGKTLSSMRLALNHNIQNGKGRVIYVIPYTSIIEQNADVLRTALGEGCDLLEHHSNVIEENKEDDYGLLSTRWNSDIVITTMVQFLNTFYARGTQDIRRFHNLLNATIIIDEAQTIPVKCMNLFNSAINFLSQIGNTTVVLCTATQPVLEGDGMVPIAKAKCSELINNVDKKYIELSRVRVVNKCRQKKYSLDEFTEFISECKEWVSSLLIVLNKVNSAQIVFRQLKRLYEGKTKLFYLSSSLAPQHKKDVLKSLRECLENNESVICVSTAVIEAGIDISFEAAIRNITKLDSIAQTAGRVNRNGEREQGVCYVVNFEEGAYGKLIEVEIGGKRSRGILDDYDDVLLPTSMEKYFKGYFIESEIKNNFNFPLNNKTGKSIYGMLHSAARNVSGLKKNNDRPNLMVNFDEAARNFEVIDQNTKAVIVPYGVEGEELVEKINNLDQFAALQEKLRLIEEARKFTVNIFAYNISRLEEEGAIYGEDILGSWLLAGAYYDPDMGVVYEASPDAYNC